jgi:hypothetical protein
VLLELTVQLVLQVLLDLTVQPVLQDQLVLQAQQVQLAYKDLQVCKAAQVQRG